MKYWTKLSGLLLRLIKVAYIMIMIMKFNIA